MKAGWRIKPLDEVALIGAGNPAPQDKRLFERGRFPFYRTSDVGQMRFGEIWTSVDLLNDEGARGLRLVPSGTVLMPKSGASTFLNHRVITCADGYASSHLATITARDGVTLPRYLLYALHLVQAQELLPENSYPSLNLSLIKGIKLPIPPLEEQRQIVAILDEAFEGLVRARANAEANLQNARDLFDSYLSTIFSKADWPNKTLPQISENLDRARVPITKGKRSSGDIPYYGASGVVDHVAEYLFDEDLLLVSEDGANLLARTYPIAFSISGKSWVNNHAHVLRFPDRDTQEFVRLYLNSISLEPYVSGMAQPKLNQDQLNRIPIPFPDLTEQSKIVAKAELIAGETADLRKQFEAAAKDLYSLRQSLLQRAFAGELT